MDNPVIERDMPECEPRNMSEAELMSWPQDRGCVAELKRRFALVERDDEYLRDAMQEMI